MREMLNIIETRLQEGEDLVLVTVTASSGATPRGAGARMLVGREGRLCGTIGGGAVEYRCQEIAGQALRKKRSGQRNFSLTRNDVENLGMICGGDVHVFFHYIPAGDEATLALAREAERLFSEGTAFWLLTDLASEGALSLFSEKYGFFGHPCPDALRTQLSCQPKRIQVENMDFCVEQINGAGRVYIFGGGHVSQELEPLLTHVGFRCVVLDDRPEFARRELFPTAEEVLLIDFSRISAAISIGAEDYVCVMTRGHASDTVVQAQVLPCRPCYVGVIGSRKKAAGVRSVLRETYGLSEELLDLVTTPIGLEIEAETPAEIAVSIAGQMIRLRAMLRKKV